MTKYKLEYIWLDGYTPVPNLRGKTQIKEFAEFPTLEKGVHLISHSLGAVPRAARAHATTYLDEWENDSINAWGSWLPAVRSLGDTIGKVLGLPEHQRLEGTLATTALGIAAGIDIVRVHDVAANVRVARMSDAVVRGDWHDVEA